MFSTEMREKLEKQVVIEDFSLKVMISFFKFVYCGKAPHLVKLSSELFLAADKVFYNILVLNSNTT